MSDQLAGGAPERIWAYPSNVTGWDSGFYAKARQTIDSHTYILATPEALAKAPEVTALLAAAILDAQLRVIERGRIDTPKAAALAQQPPASGDDGRG